MFYIFSILFKLEESLINSLDVSYFIYILMIDSHEIQQGNLQTFSYSETFGLSHFNIKPKYYFKFVGNFLHQI